MFKQIYITALVSGIQMTQVAEKQLLQDADVGISVLETLSKS
jgi:alpha-acetolactate decarboxylase